MVTPWSLHVFWGDILSSSLALKDELSSGEGQEEGKGIGHRALGTGQPPSQELRPCGCGRATAGAQLGTSSW